MDDVFAWLRGMTEATAEAQSEVIAYIPSLLGALVLLAIGWTIARLARAGALRLSGGIDRVLDRFPRVGRLSRVRQSPRMPELMGRIVFWLVILFFITAATKAAGLDAFSGWLGSIVGYLPNLVAGGLIVLVGYVLGAVVRDVVAATFTSAGVERGELGGAIAQGAIVLVAVVVGIDQIGIDIDFLVTIVAIVLTAVLGGISLAFGLGARALVGNLIGAHYLRQSLQPGQIARIGEVEGEILDLTSTSIVLATPEGRTMVPAKLFNEAATTLLLPRQDDE